MSFLNLAFIFMGEQGHMKMSYNITFKQFDPMSITILPLISRLHSEGASGPHKFLVTPLDKSHPSF